EELIKNKVGAMKKRSGTTTPQSTHRSGALLVRVSSCLRCHSRRLPVHRCRPRRERGRTNAALGGGLRNVRVIAHADEPLEHEGVVHAELADLLDRYPDELHLASRHPAKDLGGRWHGELITRDVHRPTV